MDNEDYWLCIKCKWTGPGCDILKEKVFSETKDEPAEWVWHCPDCNGIEIESTDEHIWCRTCEDVIVKNEDDQCAECATVYAEHMNDKAKGH